MTELGAAHFSDLCREGPIRAQIDTIEEKRKRAVGRFWMFIIPGLLLAVGAAVWGATSDNPVIGMVLCIALIIGSLVLAMGPLNAVGRDIKLPVLEAVSARAGLDYFPDGFDPPVFAEATAPLFGSWLSSAVFTDLFEGADEDGKRYAVYEAVLTRGHGKNRHQVFRGQIYAFQRRRRQSGATVAVPDRGLFNFFKPSGGYDRVKYESDPAFEKKFEVYSTHPAEASIMLGTMPRALLLRLREGGKLFVYIGPEDALIAVHGGDRFEPGSLFRSTAGEARVRLMFDDVCASMAVLKELRSAFG